MLFLKSQLARSVDIYATSPYASWLVRDFPWFVLDFPWFVLDFPRLVLDFPRLVRGIQGISAKASDPAYTPGSSPGAGHKSFIGVT